LPDASLIHSRELRRVLVMLAVLWLAGISTRSVWTPDEPREFGLSVSMLQQPIKSVPLLAGSPFLEKPPLTYWSRLRRAFPISHTV
jgi:4-amino-4-deoxy-L-arabinose transferase-like glycosyltransferase